MRDDVAISPLSTMLYDDETRREKVFGARVNGKEKKRKAKLARGDIN